MNTTTSRAIAMLTMLVMPALGQTTTIEVPQGSGAFPTVGQIKCLEDMGGRYCAATWACGDESGVLWGDLANNDGRRALGFDSPVSRGRSCSIEVDGAAEATWFTVFTPARDAVAIGLSPATNPKAAVIRRVVADPEGSGSFLDWVIDAHDIDLSAEFDKECGHIRDGPAFATQRRQCEFRIGECCTGYRLGGTRR